MRTPGWENARRPAALLLRGPGGCISPGKAVVLGILAERSPPGSLGLRVCTVWPARRCRWLSGIRGPRGAGLRVGGEGGAGGGLASNPGAACGSGGIRELAL